MHELSIAFIGGGNMAGAIIGGLRRAGVEASSIRVVEPLPAQRERLQQQFGVAAQPAADAALEAADVIVWAVKPQQFAQAAAALREHAPGGASALHLSIMAGVRGAAVARLARAERVVRAMPNTPALIGHGVAGLHANAACGAAERELAERVLGSTGELVWVDSEADLDAVTAVSGSGPAYMFYVLEALIAGGVRLGLSEQVSRRLALGTMSGAAALAAGSSSTPAQLREQVTSKGGTTAAALDVLGARDVAGAFDAALQAAARRAVELADALERDAAG
ncbi:MAG: pyrroline-5-carboxylate reductase [Betaproteobacteria bacterium]|nr:pyrroline-5-carboxylate reductase [Betaproteobacteria bacterium]